jgi:rod shape determining protein RodA
MNKSILQRFDYVTLIITTIIITIGIFAIYSATFGSQGVSDNFMKQLIFGIIGFVLMIAISFIPPKIVIKSSYIFYGITIILLLAVTLVGKKISGQRSWFSLGGFGIQPSEFAKIATVMALATFLSNEKRSLNSPINIIISVLIVLVPVGLIMRQPDLGTSLVFLALILPVMFWAGLSPFLLFGVITPGIAAVLAFLNPLYFYIFLAIVLVSLLFFKKNYFMSGGILVMNFIAGYYVKVVYNKLQPYQQRRIMAVFDPTTDPLGSGYNVIQAKVAIGSGGLFGKGYLKGSQTQLKFIPEQWTDFIYCMIGEEFGFIGAAVVIILYFILIFQFINNASKSKNNFLSLCCIGFATIFLFHLVINVGMTIGLMPVIGIPLPLVSYGISSLISFTIMIGLGMNTYRYRNIFTS